MYEKKGRFLIAIGVFVCLAGSVSSFILGHVFETIRGEYYIRYEYNWPLAIGGAVASILFGILYIALGEIRNHQCKLEHLITNGSLKAPEKVSADSDDIPEI